MGFHDQIIVLGESHDKPPSAAVDFFKLAVDDYAFDTLDRGWVYVRGVVDTGIKSESA